MDRRQFLLAVACSTLPPSWASAQTPDRDYRIAVISPSEAAVESIRSLQLPELARLELRCGPQPDIDDARERVGAHAGAGARGDRHQARCRHRSLRPVAILAVEESSSTVPIVMSFIGEDPVAKDWPTASPTPVAARPASRCWQPRWTGSVRRCCTSLCRRRAVSRSWPAARHAMRRAPRRLSAWPQRSGSRPMCFMPMNRQTMPQRSPVCGRPAPRRWSLYSAPDFFRDAAQLSRLALEAGLPTVCEWASMARDGCLIGYGPNFAALWRRPADYVARFCVCAKPGELPIQATQLVRVCY